MKKLIIVIIIIIVFSGCADVVVVDECLTPDRYGFLGGFWHGMVAPISFIGTLLSDDIAMYAINNNGGWYDFGFWLGIGGFSGTIFSSGSSKKRRIN